MSARSKASSKTSLPRIKALAAKQDVVFLFDVDNTLLDNDRLQNDLFRHIGRDFGKKALFGRCFMFMDALDPKVVKVHRKAA